MTLRATLDQNKDRGLFLLVKDIREMVPCLFLVSLVALIRGTSADYNCLCLNDEERELYEKKSSSSSVIGYMYRFDCFPIQVDAGSTSNWLGVLFDHQLGFIATDAKTERKVCFGAIPDEAKLTGAVTTATTPQPSTASTSAPSTSTPTSVPPSATTTPTSTSTPTSPSTMSSRSTLTSVPTSATTPTSLPTPSSPSTMSSTPSTTRSPSSSTGTSLVPTMSSTTHRSTSTPSTTSTTQITSTITPSTTRTTTTTHRTTSTPSTTTSSTSTSNITPSTTKRTTTTTISTTHSTTPTTITSTKIASSTPARTTRRTTSTTLPSSTVPVSSPTTSVTPSRTHSTDTNSIASSSTTRPTTSPTIPSSTVHHVTSSFKGLHVNYTNWMYGHTDINSNPNVDCAVFMGPIMGGKWKDASCYRDINSLFDNNLHPWICQYSAPSHVTFPWPITTVQSVSVANSIPAVSAIHIQATKIPQVTSNGQIIKKCRNNHHIHILAAAHEQSCYQFYYGYSTWSGADYICKHEGGFLFQILDDDDNQFIGSLLAKAGYRGNVWMGYTDARHEGTWEWISGKQSTYTNWVSGHRDVFNHHYEDCAVFQANDGKWNEAECNSAGIGNRHHWICQFDTYPAITPTKVPLPTTSVGPAISSVLALCPRFHSDAVIGGYGNSCFEFTHNLENWTSAEQQCVAHGGHLFEITSSNEEQFILSLLAKANYVGSVWMGLNDIKQEGHWEWSSGIHSTYIRFVNLQNSGQTHQASDCVVQLGTKGHGLWSEEMCFSVHPFICRFS